MPALHVRRDARRYIASLARWLSVRPVKRPPSLRFGATSRLGFTSAFVRLRRDESARQVRLHLTSVFALLPPKSNGSVARGPVGPQVTGCDWVRRRMSIPHRTGALHWSRAERMRCQSSSETGSKSAFDNNPIRPLRHQNTINSQRSNECDFSDCDGGILVGESRCIA